VAQAVPVNSTASRPAMSAQKALVHANNNTHRRTVLLRAGLYDRSTGSSEGAAHGEAASTAASQSLRPEQRARAVPHTCLRDLDSPDIDFCYHWNVRYYDNMQPSAQYCRGGTRFSRLGRMSGRC
jgi:hypothetical protein